MSEMVIDFLKEPKVDMERLDSLRERLADSQVYYRTYFRINAGYQWGGDNPGMQRDKTEVLFEELQDILRSLGFGIDREDGSYTCPEAWRGFEYLYCHPMDLSGHVKKESIPEIERGLGSGENFKLTVVDTYEPILNYGPDELLETLTFINEEIRDKILCKLATKRSNLYVAEWRITTMSPGPFVKIDAHYYDKNRELEKIARDYVLSALESLIEEGRVVKGQLKAGVGYRTSNEEKKLLKKEGKI